MQFSQILFGSDSIPTEDHFLYAKSSVEILIYAVFWPNSKMFHYFFPLLLRCQIKDWCSSLYRSNTSRCSVAHSERELLNHRKP